MLEFIGTYFFLLLWGLTIALVISIAFNIFLKRDASKQLAEILLKITGAPQPTTEKLENELREIRKSQELRDNTLDKIIKQHDAFVKFLRNVAQNDGKVDISCFEENVQPENESERKLLLDYRRERRRSSLFDIYDNK